MKKNIALFFILILNFLVLSAQDLSRVKLDIDTLTSPAFHGRGYVNYGDSIAANYIKNRFQKIGVSPLASLNNYYQPFTIDINTFPNKMLFRNGRKELTPGKSFIVHPDAPSFKGKLKLFIPDTLIFSNLEKRSAFLKLDLSEIALVLDAKLKQKIKFASTELRKQIYAAPVFIWLIEKKLTASLSNHQKFPLEIDVLKDSIDLHALNLKINIEASLLRNYTTKNIVSMVKGTSQPDSFVVICAHYDHLGRMGKETYFPGANDNAAGIAMLLQLAEYYKANPQKYSILFIAFGAEEPGLIGSEYFVKNCPVPLHQIKFVMNLDLVGTGDDGAMVVNGSIYKKDFENLTKINETNHYLPIIKARAKAPNSDHYHFSENGVPSFFLFLLGGITAYHDVWDVAATLPLTRFTETYKLIQEFVNQQ